MNSTKWGIRTALWHLAYSTILACALTAVLVFIVAQIAKVGG